MAMPPLRLLAGNDVLLLVGKVVEAGDEQPIFPFGDDMNAEPVGMEGADEDVAPVKDWVLPAPRALVQDNSHFFLDCTLLDLLRQQDGYSRPAPWFHHAAGDAPFSSFNSNAFWLVGRP